MEPMKHIKVLILSRYDYYYANILKGMMELNISFRMDIDIYEKLKIDFDKIKKSPYD